MKDSVRRMLLFFGIVTVGVVLLFIELPFLYLLLIVSLFGIFLLFITGALSLKDLRREKDDSEKPVKQEGPTFGERFAEKAPSFYALYTKLTGGKRKPKEKAEKKGGGLFGRGKKEEKAVATASAGVKADSGESIDDELDDDDLFGDINLDELDNEGLDDFGGDDAVIDMGEDDADMADDVAAILAQAGDLDDDLSDGAFDQTIDTSFDDSSDDDLLTADDDLDSIDLDDLETGDEEELPDGFEDLDELDDPLADSPVEEEESWDKKAKDQFSFGDSVEAISSNVGLAETTPKESKSSFFSKSSGGGMGEGDLLSELKSSTKNIKKKQDVSLVRELKDAEVTPQELEEELSNLLTILGGKKDN